MPRRSGRCRRRRSGTAGRRARTAPSSRRCRTAARAARRAMRRRRRASRIGSPAGAQAAAQRPPHVDALAAPSLLVAARAPQRRRELRGATSAGRAARARAARARRSSFAASSSSSLGQRQRHLDLGVDRPRRRRPGGADETPMRGVRSARAVPCSARGRSSGGAAAVRASSGTTSSSCRAVPEDREEHGVERRDLRRIGDEHGARRPVQPPPGDRPDERERACEVGRARRA